jgi:hypothetical protein
VQRDDIEVENEVDLERDGEAEAGVTFGNHANLGIIVLLQVPPTVCERKIYCGRIPRLAASRTTSEIHQFSIRFLPFSRVTLHAVLLAHLFCKLLSCPNADARLTKVRMTLTLQRR